LNWKPPAVPSALDLFLPPVQSWFRTALGHPTPAQEKSWPAIARGDNTLILAPTGSGKTLAAFLACLDALWRQPQIPAGVQVLYISPLKALNNDIYRNLQLPLQGVAETARAGGYSLPEIHSAVRTGDTPQAERQRLLRQPPHVLITTPESLNLLLTSKARETLRQVRWCIVDEIHAVCTTKRGVFLSLLLERLSALNPDGFLRIGLSATQRPLEEVARFLGGRELSAAGEFVPRPVTIVDAGLRKEMDLQVVSPVEQFGLIPEKTVWPSIYRLLAQEIRGHQSTIIFANDRRGVERITAQVNIALEESNTADEAIPLVRAHHGSVALEVRQATETALKEGRLAAVVATASLELGIDMGAVELVCQVASPGNVSRGLQRVGRAGHLVGHKSKGRLIPRTLSDLLEQAVLAREMFAGRVEECRVPTNCLDVLAQQIIALVAVESWEVPKLLELLRRAYPYRDLSPAVLETVLEMVTGRYRFQTPPKEESPAKRPGHTLNALQPRISWDRIHNRLHSLPGSKQLALLHGGTIPDTGQYAVYTGTQVRIGELDEEFVYERRVGEAFLLGTNTWRIDKIDTDRVLVSPAEGAQAVLPFWKGEGTGRSYELGTAIGGFLRELAQRLETADCQSWLREHFHLDQWAARNLRWHVLRQLERAGCLPTDQTLYIEASRDQLGDWQVMLLSPLGKQIHLGLRLALESRLKQRLGYRPQCLHHDDGLLIRLTDCDEPILDLLDGLTPDNVTALVLEELLDSPLFALRFRQNAARALLMPTGGAGKRAPLWLQRLRGRDLLQVARQHPDFPIVGETVRECLHDYLDLPRLQELLARVRTGEVQVISKRTETASPFASNLLFAFTAVNMYQWDGVESDSSQSTALDRNLLEQLLSPESQTHLLNPRAIQQVEHRLRGVGRPPRTSAETAEWLRRLGDLAPAELEGPMTAYLQELETDGRAKLFELPSRGARWLLTEEEPLYRRAFALDTATPDEQHAAAESILLRFLNTHALVSLADVLTRYPFEPEWTKKKLEEWSRQGRMVPVATGDIETMQWSAPENLEQVQRGSLGLLRREVTTVPPQVYADFLLRWQGLHPDHTPELGEVLATLQGVAVPAGIWEQVLLPLRIPAYSPRWLDELLASGAWIWACRGNDEGGPGDLSFFPRDSLTELQPPASFADLNLGRDAETVLQCLQQRGALFVADICQHTVLPPGKVRAILWQLLRSAVATNDRFDVIRSGEPVMEVPPAHPRSLRRGYRPGRITPEGRWSLLPWGHPGIEEQVLCRANLLLQRHGIAARELAQQDPLMPPWRVLYEVLSQMEMAGDVRRGYFVEGLSGAQFALPEAARQLSESAIPSTATAPAILLNSCDPANLYGSGAPFDIPLLDGGTRPLLRRPGNWLVLCAGRPVLLVEQQGRKITALPSAREEQLAVAVGRLPELLHFDSVLAARHKLCISEWNNETVAGSPAQPLLEALGFVRDYQDMTLYAGWS
jgi:ATP-dependent Lhr-like helicase